MAMSGSGFEPHLIGGLHAGLLDEAFAVFDHVVDLHVNDACG